MRRKLFGCLTAAVAGVSLLLAQGGPGGATKGKDKGPEPCERACLEGFVEQYLDALVAHNPFGLPLAARVKFSENDQLLDLGDGLWNVVTGLGTYKLIVSDPQSQQVGFLGGVSANGRSTAFALRLKLENRRISEIETLVTVGVPVLGIAPAPSPVFTQAAANRRPREELLASLNGFFDAQERGDAALVRISPRCDRYEKGVKTTNIPTSNASMLNFSAMSCAEQLRSRVFANFQMVYPRRMPIVDEERQLVFGFFTHQQPGDLLQVEIPGRGIYKFPEESSQPAFVEAAMVFRFEEGAVQGIESFTSRLPYGTPNPFFGDGWRRAKQK